MSYFLSSKNLEIAYGVCGHLKWKIHTIKTKIEPLRVVDTVDDLTAIFAAFEPTIPVEIASHTLTSLKSAFPMGIPLTKELIRERNSKFSDELAKLQWLQFYNVDSFVWDTLVKWSCSLTPEEYSKKYNQAPELSLEEFKKMGGNEQHYQFLLYHDLASKESIVADNKQGRDLMKQINLSKKLENQLMKWSQSLSVEEYERRYKKTPELSLEAFQKMGGMKEEYEQLLFYDMVSKEKLKNATNSFAIQIVNASVSMALEKWAEEYTLSEIIDLVYELNPDWKPLTERPQVPPINTFLEWNGREDIVNQILFNFNRNCQSFLSKICSKHEYRVPIIYGGLGVGKTRTVYHSIQLWKEKLLRSEFDYFANVFIDFSLSGTDAWNAENWDSIDSSLSIGFRLASRFFFGVGCDSLWNFLRKHNFLKKFVLFSFREVITEIQKRNGLSFDGRKLCLAIQLDEYQQIMNGDKLNQIMRNLTNHMINQHDTGIFLVVACSGTNPNSDYLSASQLHPTLILLGSLSENEAKCSEEHCHEKNQFAEVRTCF